MQFLTKPLKNTKAMKTEMLLYKTERKTDPKQCTRLSFWSRTKDEREVQDSSCSDFS